MICGFCNREHTDVPQLVAGPRDNNICIDCSELIATGIIRNPIRLKEKVTCSFCGISDNFPHGMGVGGKVTICLHCVLSTLKTIRTKNSQSLIGKLELIINPEVNAIKEV